MNAVARVITCRASSLLPDGFSRGNLHWCRRIQPAKDIDLTCCKTLPIKATTCSQVGPMSLEWPVDPIAGSDQSSPSSSHEDPNDEHQEGALPASSHSGWRRDALQPPQVRHGTAGRDTCGHFTDGGLRSITWNTPRRKTGSSNSNISGSSLTTTTSRVSRRYTGRMIFSRLFRCWLRDSSFLVLSFLVTRMQEDRPFTSTRIFCLRMLL